MLIHSRPEDADGDGSRDADRTLRGGFRERAGINTIVGGHVADLSLNSNALSGFAGTLRGLVGDFSQPIFVERVCTDVLNDDLEMLASADKTCGDGLANYLNSLASLSDAAATAAHNLDLQLAREAGGHHGRVRAQ